MLKLSNGKKVTSRKGAVLWKVFQRYQCSHSKVGCARNILSATRHTMRYVKHK